MNTLQVEGHDIALDKDGFLKELTDWSAPVAIALAQREGLELNDEHWLILNLLRDFYAQFQLSPATRPLVKYVAQQLGPDIGNSHHLNRCSKVRQPSWRPNWQACRNRRICL